MFLYKGSHIFEVFKAQQPQLLSYIRFANSNSAQVRLAKSLPSLVRGGAAACQIRTTCLRFALGFDDEVGLNVVLLSCRFVLSRFGIWFVGGDSPRVVVGKIGLH